MFMPKIETKTQVEVSMSLEKPIIKVDGYFEKA